MRTCCTVASDAFPTYRRTEYKVYFLEHDRAGPAMLGNCSATAHSKTILSFCATFSLHWTWRCEMAKCDKINRGASSRSWLLASSLVDQLKDSRRTRRPPPPPPFAWIKNGPMTNGQGKAAANTIPWPLWLMSLSLRGSKTFGQIRTLSDGGWTMHDELFLSPAPSPWQVSCLTVTPNLC